MDGSPSRSKAKSAKFLRPRELAKQLELSEYLIYGMLRRGEIRAIRPGTRFLIPIAERARLLAGLPLEEAVSQPGPPESEL